jgi:hypothetical protein
MRALPLRCRHGKKAKKEGSDSDEDDMSEDEDDGDSEGDEGEETLQEEVDLVHGPPRMHYRSAPWWCEQLLAHAHHFFQSLACIARLHMHVDMI